MISGFMTTSVKTLSKDLVLEMSVISGDGCVLIERTEYEALFTLKERVEMKIRQLERTDCEDYGGIGTKDDAHDRKAYIKALRWAIGKEYGEM
jgi:hypothetical protein